MKTLLYLWDKLTAPPVHLTDAQRAADARALSAVVLCVIVVALVGITLTLPSYTDREAPIMRALAAGTSLLFIPYALSRVGRVIAAAHLLALLAFVLLLGGVVGGERTLGRELLRYFVVITMFAALFLPWAMVGVYTALSFAAIGVYAAYFPDVALVEVVRGPVVFTAVTSVFIVFFAVFARWRDQQKRLLLYASEQKKAALLIKQRQYTVLAQFVRAVTHGFGTQLQSIEVNRFYVQRVIERNGDLTTAAARLETIGSAALAIGDELRQLNLLLRLNESPDVPVEVVPLVEALVASRQPAAGVRQIALALHAADAADAWIIGDRQQLLFALEQLVDEALACTDVGGTIAIEAARQGDQIVIAVSTRSPQPEPSDTLDSPTLRMTIARTIVEVYNGHFQADDVPGQGRTLTVSLPRWNAQTAGTR